MCARGWNSSGNRGRNSHRSYRTHRSIGPMGTRHMSTAAAQDVSPSDNGQPTVAATAPIVMIRQVAIAAEDPKERALKRQVPAFLASGLFHACLAAAFFLYSWWTTRDRTVVAPAEQIVETRVEDAPTEKQNFNNEDVGLDPDKPLTYNNDRLDDISVPGKVIADAKVGIEGAPEGPPRSEEHTSELQSLRHLVCRLLL